MLMKSFPVIDLVATGNNIRRLRLERGLTVRDLQRYFGFEEPRAIYKWQKGESLPTVDNLYALGNLLEVPMEQNLVPVAVKFHIVGEQQGKTCCSSCFMPLLTPLLPVDTARNSTVPAGIQTGPSFRSLPFCKHEPRTRLQAQRQAHSHEPEWRWFWN